MRTIIVVGGESKKRGDPRPRRSRKWLASSRQSTRILSLCPWCALAGGFFLPLIHRRRGRKILRTSPLRSSRKLARSGFAAAFLLQHLLASTSDLHTDEPKGGYGLLSLMPYAPKVFLVRPRAPILFQPLVHLEDTPKHCLCAVLQLQQRCVRPAQQEHPLVADLAWPLAFSFKRGFLYFAARLGEGAIAVGFFWAHQRSRSSMLVLATSPANGARP